MLESRASPFHVHFGGGKQRKQSISRKTLGLDDLECQETDTAGGGFLPLQRQEGDGRVLAAPSRARAEEQQRPRWRWCITCLQILLLSAACRARKFSFVVALSRVFCQPGSKVSEQKTIQSTENEVARKYNYCVGPCKGSLWSLSPRYATEKGKLFYRGSWIVLAQQGKVHYKSQAKALQMTTPIQQLFSTAPLAAGGSRAGSGAQELI